MVCFADSVCVSFDALHIGTQAVAILRVFEYSAAYRAEYSTWDS